MTELDAFWNPVSCTLQLYFGGAQSATKDGAADSASRTITAGSTYTGTSTILYRRDPLPLEAKKYLSGDSHAPPVLSEYDAFYKHLAHLSRSNGLHVHACTSPSPSKKRLRPLEKLSYQVHCSNVNSPLKILSILEEDVVREGNHQAEKGGRSALVKPRKGGKSPNIPTAANSPWDKSDVSLATEGSKLIVVGPLPLGVEVTLGIRFRGTVQEGEDGAIYSPVGRHAAPSSCSFPILTHFEVALARWAFPCPDHPQYRLRWHLKTLQLPSGYHTVVSHTSFTEAASGEAGGRQYRFAPCGPLPAYAFAFAAFAGPHALTAVSGTLSIPHAGRFWQEPPPANLHLDGNLGTVASCEGEGGADALDLSVMATAESGVQEITLVHVLHIVQEAVRLLQSFFYSPLPLLQCDRMTVLLAPTMPYISGMEHHCCITLNEALFSTKSMGGAKKANKDNHSVEVEQAELIVHEIVHHWIGNAVGLPFAVKEGVCMVLEKIFADIILYGRQKRHVAGLQVGKEGAPAAGKVAHGVGSESQQKNIQPAKAIQDPKKGKEFTGVAYQRAQLDIQEAIEACGFVKFRAKLLQMVRQCVLKPLMEEQTHGNVGPMYHTSITASSDSSQTLTLQNYWSSENFLRWIQQADDEGSTPEENKK